jgi:soluble lytic murein transglycosylase
VWDGGFDMFFSVLKRFLLLGVCFAPLGLPVADINPFSATVAVAASGQAVQAVQSAIEGNFEAAGQLARSSGDEAAIRLVEMLYLKDQGEKAGYSRLVDFLETSPKWPLNETMAKRAEAALFHDQHSPQEVIAFFAKREPMTAEGKFALARANYASGNTKSAREMLRQGWMDTEFDSVVEKKVLSEFGSNLSINDHKNRMWRLILAQSPNAAVRASKRIGGSHTQAAEAAQYLINGSGGAEKKLAALPGELRNATAMKYALARYYRKLEKFSKARSVLATIPAEASTLDPDAIWTERRIIARRSMGPRLKQHWNAAYKIARDHGATSGTTAVEGEFLSGFISLRYKNDADTALAHFKRSASYSVTRTDKARASYWIGRAEMARKNTTAARDAFNKAAQHSTIYYGQLAREHIGLGKVPEKIDSGSPSAAAMERVEKDEVVRAFRLVARAGKKDHLNLFLWSLASRFDNADDMNAVASIVHNAGGLNMALRFAKAAGQRGVDIDSWAYPTKGLPGWKSVGKPIERAMVFGLSRQESEFNAKAGSSAGAQGLMQLLPGTARLVARQHGLPFAAPRLINDPAYNVKLGAAHLADLVAEYRGSYIMTLVAYNAGPRRVTEWIDAFGDPRTGEIDPIDWVENIPFHETRQYVQKVLQNVHIYRSRLAPDTVKPMSADLRRGGDADVEVASTSTLEPASCGGKSITQLVTRCD